MKDYQYSRDKVYLNEKRYHVPKECFKQGAEYLNIKENGDDKSILDIGCATGEFLYHIYTIHQSHKLIGVDYSENLVKSGDEYLQPTGIKLFQGDANNLRGLFNDSTFDIVTTFGVAGIFDDFRPSFSEMIRVANNGATCLNFMLLNEYPLDILIKYIRPGATDPHSGWNKFSRKSVEDYLLNHSNVPTFKLIKHVMPFDILPHEDDPIRSWTIKNEKGERILWNGLNMEVSLYFVIFNIKK